jgi:hypothetical protein
MFLMLLAPGLAGCDLADFRVLCTSGCFNLDGRLGASCSVFVKFLGCSEVSKYHGGNLFPGRTSFEVEIKQ